MWDAADSLLRSFEFGLGLVSLLCGGLVVWLAVWFARRIGSKWREADGIVADWPRAQATITAVPVVQRWVPDAPGGVPTMQAEYAFTDLQGASFTGTDVEFLLQAPVVGAHCEVAYDPEDPTSHHLTARMRTRIWTWGVLAITVDVLLLGCAALFIWLGLDTIR